jgi:hypothetical protein
VLNLNDVEVLKAKIARIAFKGMRRDGKYLFPVHELDEVLDEFLKNLEKPEIRSY